MKAMLRGVTKGLPQTGLQGGAGVAVFYLHRMLSEKVAFVQNRPLAAPIAFILLGHALKKSKKLGTVGAALVGAGGYAGAQVFEVRKALKTQAPAPAAQVSGFEDDTGMLVQPHNIGMLVEPSNIGDVSGSNDYNVGSSAYNEAYAL